MQWSKGRLIQRSTRPFPPISRYALDLRLLLGGTIWRAHQTAGAAMQQNRDAADIRRRLRSDRHRAGIGDPLGLLQTFSKLEPTPSLPMPRETAGQLGRNIILAAENPYPGNISMEIPPLAARQTRFNRQTLRDFPKQQGFIGSRASTAFAPPAQPSRPAVQPTQRSLFDLAGRFRDFQAGPKIARPNLAEEFIPVVGPAWDAVADLQDGHYGSAAFNGAMALGDLLPVGYGIKAGRGALKLVREMKTLTPKAAAIQRKMHKIGLALPTEDVHHIFELNGLGRYVPNWKNNPLFLKVLPREVHQRLHRRWGGKPKFGLVPRLWHGTTDWMKAGAAGIGSYATDGLEDVERWLSADSQPSLKKAQLPR